MHVVGDPTGRTAGQHARAAVHRLRLRTLVGLIPLLAVETIDPELLEALPGFKQRLEWFLQNRPELASLVSRWQEPGVGERRLLGRDVAAVRIAFR